MRPTSVTVSSLASSAWIPVDYKQAPFNVGFGVVVPSGTLTYKVEHTYDDPYEVASPTPFDHPTAAGKTDKFDGSYSSPIRAIRLTATAWTSGSAVMTILQGLR